MAISVFKRLPFFVHTAVKLRVLPIEEDGFHLQVQVLINNQPANFLLDIGASRTVFDINRIRHFISDLITETNTERRSTGLGTSSMEIHNAIIGSFKIGDIELCDLDSAFLDLSHVNESYNLLNIEEIDGVLGNDILIEHKAVIDFEKELLYLHLPA